MTPALEEWKLIPRFPLQFQPRPA